MSFQSCSTAARLLSSGWTFFAHASPGTAAMHHWCLLSMASRYGLEILTRSAYALKYFGLMPRSPSGSSDSMKIRTGR